MISLSQPLTDFVIYNGKRIKLDVSFDNVLKMYDIFKDDFLNQQEKSEFALAILCKSRKLPPVPILDLIFKEHIETFSNPKQDNKLRVVDFKQDAPYIYSSFLMDYGIDLINQQGKLHWQKFISLFQGLSEKTKIREIMSIRSKPIPEPNKHNHEYIRNLMELKAYYALEISQAEREKNFQAGLKRLAQALMAQANGGG